MSTIAGFFLLPFKTWRARRRVQKRLQAIRNTIKISSLDPAKVER